MKKLAFLLVLVLAVGACGKKKEETVPSAGARPTGGNDAVTPAVIPPAQVVDASAPLHGVYESDCEKETSSDQGYNLNGRRTYVTIKAGNVSSKLVRFVDVNCDTTRFTGTVEYTPNNWDFTVTKVGEVDGAAFTLKYTTYNGRPLGAISTSEDVTITREDEPFAIDAIRFSLEAGNVYRRKQ